MNKGYSKFSGLNAALFFLALVFQFASCNSLSKNEQSLKTDNSQNIVETEKVSPAGADLERNRALWKESNIVNYNFVAEQFAGGMYPFVPFQIKVRNGKAVSMKPTEKPAQLQRTDGYDTLNTVEKMFDKIQSAIGKDDYLTVTYNKEFGYPELISTSPKTGGADSYWRVKITNFEIPKNE